MASPCGPGGASPSRSPGAPAPASVDGRPVAHATLVDVPDGATFTLGMPATGLRTYLTVRGGIDVPPVLGSRSTDTLSHLGPPPVRVGDVLPVGSPGRDFPTVDHAAHPAASARRARRCSRCCPARGPPGSAGGRAALGGLLGVDRVVSGDSDRVGLRLTGSPRAAHRPWVDAELPSEGMVRGAIQVPPGGEPVVFLADHPVTGGYPVVGVLTASALRPRGPAAPGRPGAPHPGGLHQLRWVGSTPLRCVWSLPAFTPPCASCELVVPGGSNRTTTDFDVGQLLPSATESSGTSTLHSG